MAGWTEYRFELTGIASPTPEVALTGHLWTLSGYLRRSLRPQLEPPSVDWSTRIADPELGSVRLTGRLSRPAGARVLVILVHGLGGSSQSPYVLEAASQVHKRGWACLRLNLRGADRSGEDIYHAGLTADLEGALASREGARFEGTAIVGFSLGGHAALRLALDRPTEALRAVAAICPPFDLAAAAQSIDATGKWLYRRYLLGRLFEVYEEVARRRALPRSVEEVRKASTFVEFDTEVIAPRFGFADAWDYYRRMSVGPALAGLAVPSMVVAAREDPMVPAASLGAPEGRSSQALEIRWSDRGGHLAFPRNLDLGAGGELGLYPQLTTWLAARLPV